jgi:DNA-binding GntR family transcriptional regulator
MDQEGISRAEYVYRRLREGIRDGSYRPGHRLREVQIAQELETSRTPVREAIRRLETDRLVEDVPGRGLSVTRLDEARVRELYQFRTALEGAAAEMAALHASEMDVATLAGTLVAMREAADDAARAARLNREFHRAIHAAARNSFLTHAIESMRDFMALLPGTTYQAPGRMEEVLREHDAVLRAIRDRASARAGDAMRAHIQAAGQHRVRMVLAAC